MSRSDGVTRSVAETESMSCWPIFAPLVMLVYGLPWLKVAALTRNSTLSSASGPETEPLTWYSFSSAIERRRLPSKSLVGFLVM